MNKDLSKLTKDLVSIPTAFKQDPKLVAAIDKLWRQQVISLNGEVGEMLLPQRKLDFTEVQNMLKESVKSKGIVDNKILLKVLLTNIKLTSCIILAPNDVISI